MPKSLSPCKWQSSRGNGLKKNSWVFRYLIKKLKRNSFFYFLTIANLCLGLGCFLFLEGSKSKIQNTLKSRSKETLSADLVISGRRKPEAKEWQQIKKQMGENYQMTENIEFYSLIATPEDETRLVFVKAIEQQYPFYGKLRTSNNQKSIHSKASVLISPELALQMKLTVGSQIKLGQLNLKVSGVIQEDSSQGLGQIRYAPVVYINKKFLAQSKLLGKQSLVFYRYLFKLPIKTDLEMLQNSLRKSITKSGLKIRNHENASAQLQKTTRYFDDFLSLLSLVGLFLTAIGFYYLYRNNLQKNLKDFSILRLLGAQNSDLKKYILWQSFFIATFCCLLSLVFCQLSLNFLAEKWLGWIHDVRSSTLNNDFLTLGLKAFLVSFPLVFFSTLPLLQKLSKTKALEFNRKNVDFSKDSKFTFKSSLLFLPAFIFFWLLSVWQAHSFIIGSFFMLALILAASLIALSAFLLLAFLQKTGPKLNFKYRLPLRELTRSKLENLNLFVILACGCMLIAMVGHLSNTLNKELTIDHRQKLPSLFLFDIQQEQKDPLQQFIKENKAQPRRILALVRAELLKINNKEFTQIKNTEDSFESREEDWERWARNRIYNLSYSEKGLAESEEITKGKVFKKNKASNDLWQISLERRFATRLKIKIGDQLEFAIQGVPLKGQVVNFRRIRWTSFDPNFFIVFEPGALKDAPQSFIASIAGLNAEKKSKFLVGLQKKFPNVSAIDIDKLIVKLLAIFSQLSRGLYLLSACCFLMALFILYAIGLEKARRKKHWIALIKTLGSSLNTIRFSLFIEYLIISLGASTLGCLLSLAMGKTVSILFFDSLWSPNYFQLALVWIFCPVIATGLSLLVSEKVLRTKASEALKEA